MFFFCFSLFFFFCFFLFFFLGFAAFYRVSAIDAKIRSPKSKRSSYNRVTGFYWVFFSFAGRSGGGGGRKRNCKLKKKGGGAWTAGPGGGEWKQGRNGTGGEREKSDDEKGWTEHELITNGLGPQPERALAPHWSAPVT